MAREKKSPELTPEEIKKQKEAKAAEIKRKKDEQKQREFIDKKLKKCEFKEVDDRKYSFVFGGGKFVFRIPNFLEKTKIKLILSQVTAVPGTGILSSTYEIEGSGDLDLLCNTKLLTHITVLLDESPDKFDIEKLSDKESFELGNLILLSENEFIGRKKKVSTDGQ